MKVSVLLGQRSKGPLPPVPAQVLDYLEAHPDEVYPYRDQRLARSLGIKVSALNWTLWGLHQRGLIDREKVGRRIYFGSRRAITDLRRRLGIERPDPFQRARANAERIRARVGNIDTRELLDAVRGPWE